MFFFSQAGWDWAYVWHTFHLIWSKPWTYLGPIFDKSSSKASSQKWLMPITDNDPFDVFQWLSQELATLRPSFSPISIESYSSSCKAHHVPPTFLNNIYFVIFQRAWAPSLRREPCLIHCHPPPPTVEAARGANLSHELNNRKSLQSFLGPLKKEAGVWVYKFFAQMSCEMLKHMGSNCMPETCQSIWIAQNEMWNRSYVWQARDLSTHSQISKHISGDPNAAGDLSPVSPLTFPRFVHVVEILQSRQQLQHLIPQALHLLLDWALEQVQALEGKGCQWLQCIQRRDPVVGDVELLEAGEGCKRVEGGYPVVRDIELLQVGQTWEAIQGSQANTHKWQSLHCSELLQTLENITPYIYLFNDEIEQKWFISWVVQDSLWFGCEHKLKTPSLWDNWTRQPQGGFTYPTAAAKRLFCMIVHFNDHNNSALESWIMMHSCGFWPIPLRGKKPHR